MAIKPASDVFPDRPADERGVVDAETGEPLCPHGNTITSSAGCLVCTLGEEGAHSARLSAAYTTAFRRGEAVGRLRAAGIDVEVRNEGIVARRRGLRFAMAWAQVDDAIFDVVAAIREELRC